MYISGRQQRLGSENFCATALSRGQGIGICRCMGYGRTVASHNVYSYSKNFLSQGRRPIHIIAALMIYADAIRLRLALQSQTNHRKLWL